MKSNRLKALPPVFIIAALIISGCVTAPTVEGSSAQDAKINSLQEIIDDQQRQLRELNDRFNECDNAVKPGQKESAATAG